MTWQAAAISGGMGLISGWANNRQAMVRQHDAETFEAQQFATRYQTQVRDLQAAGLNPMLAYTNGAPPAPSMSAAGSAGYGNPGEDAVNSYNSTRVASAQEAQLTAQVLKTQAETKNVDADTLIKTGMPELIAAQVVQATNSAAQSAAIVQKIRQEIPLVQESIKKLTSEIQLNKKDLSLKDSLIESNNYLNALRSAEMYLTDARARQTTLEGDVLGPKAKAAKMATAEGGAIADNIGKIGRAAWSFLSPVGSLPQN